jgi:hypothetical protein
MEAAARRAQRWCHYGSCETHIIGRVLRDPDCAAVSLCVRERLARVPHTPRFERGGGGGDRDATMCGGEAAAPSVLAVDTPAGAFAWLRERRAQLRADGQLLFRAAVLRCYRHVCEHERGMYVHADAEPDERVFGTAHCDGVGLYRMYMRRVLDTDGRVRHKWLCRACNNLLELVVQRAFGGAPLPVWRVAVEYLRGSNVLTAATDDAAAADWHAVERRADALLEQIAHLASE